MSDEETLNLLDCLVCPLDCDNCEKTVKQCLRDMRITLNLLMRDFLKKCEKMLLDNERMDSMVS